MTSDPHAEGFQTLVATVTGPKGELDAATRGALFEGTDRPEELTRFAETIEKHAYKVTDSMVEELKAAGYSEDQIFEAAVAVSVRSAADRLDAHRSAMGAAT